MNTLAANCCKEQTFRNSLSNQVGSSTSTLQCLGQHLHRRRTKNSYNLIAQIHLDILYSWENVSQHKNKDQIDEPIGYLNEKGHQ